MVYANTNGMPSTATTVMMASVPFVEAALATVRLYSGSAEETIRLGNSVSPKRKVNAAMVQDDDTRLPLASRFVGGHGLGPTARPDGRRQRHDEVRPLLDCDA